ncbi:MAG: glycosyl hydrolase, partial [Bacteroidota bacterium]
GGESGYIVPDPDNWKITYGGGYDGYLGKYNYENNQNQDISVYPESTIGAGSVSRINRFQWTFPIAISPFNSKIIYVGSQYVYRSMDAGMSWIKISDDLTRHDSTRLQPSGGPINKDNTGAEVYADVYAIAESPIQKGVIWTGSDDGLIYISTDDGKTWKNVTPPTSLLPEWAIISIVEPSHYIGGCCYISATRYKSDDNKPYLLKTTDYGETWSMITSGLPQNIYTRCIREDNHRQGLLFAGTETGIYFSTDDGANWHTLQCNLPITPVMDIQIHPEENDLVIATHGRSFWILDDMSFLYMGRPTLEIVNGDKDPYDASIEFINHKVDFSKNFIYKPRATYRIQGGSFHTDYTGENAPNGVIIRYWLKNKPAKELKFIFLTEKGDTIITYSSTKDKKGEPIKISKDFYQEKKIERDGILTADSGLNTFVWDMRYDDPERLDGAVLWNGYTTPKVVPGEYKVQMFIGDSLIQIMPFEIKMDPAVTVETEDLQAQLDYIQAANKKLGEVHKAVKDLRSIRTQVNDFIAGVTDTAVAHQLRDYTKTMLDTLDLIENNFVNLKAKAGQDVLKYPIVLNDKISALAGGANSADAKPSPQFYDALTDLSARADVYLRMMDRE